MDLKVLAQLASATQDESGCVSVKCQKDLSESERNALWERVQALRADGSRVVFELDGQIETEGELCSARLYIQNGKVVLDGL